MEDRVGRKGPVTWQNHHAVEPTGLCAFPGSLSIPTWCRPSLTKTSDLLGAAADLGHTAQGLLVLLSISAFHLINSSCPPGACLFFPWKATSCFSRKIDGKGGFYTAIWIVNIHQSLEKVYASRKQVSGRSMRQRCQSELWKAQFWRSWFLAEGVISWGEIFSTSVRKLCRDME